MWTELSGFQHLPSQSGAQSTINSPKMSMMSGDVNIGQNSTDASSTINLQDSAMSGDINITQNNAEDIATAMVQALERLGFAGQSSPTELTPEQEKEVEQVLEMSEELANHGIEIDPWTEITLGNAAELAGRTILLSNISCRLWRVFRKHDERDGESTSEPSQNYEATLLKQNGCIENQETDWRPRRRGEFTGQPWTIAETRGDLRNTRECLAIKREIGDRGGEANSLNNLDSSKENEATLLKQNGCIERV